MTATHAHLILNHAPVIGSIAALLLLLLGMVRRSAEIRRAALMAMVLVAIVAVPTFLTGEPAEKALKHTPGTSVTESVISPHEDNARIALIGSIVLGLLAVVGLAVYRTKSEPGWFAGLVLVLSLALAVQFGRTANYGGMIRHTEIRSGAAVGQSASADSAEAESEEHEEHH